MRALIHEIIAGMKKHYHLVHGHLNQVQRLIESDLEFWPVTLSRDSFINSHYCSHLSRKIKTAYKALLDPWAISHLSVFISISISISISIVIHYSRDSQTVTVTLAPLKLVIQLGPNRTITFHSIRSSHIHLIQRHPSPTTPT